jgi:transcriptional regulator with XRE-family HTH domain
VSSTFRHALIRAIAAERVRAGLTQEALGEKLGWSRRTIQNIEAGEREVLAHELVDICRALDVTLDLLTVRAAAADREVLGFGAGPS